MSEPLKIERVPRTVIEDQLLAALDDKSKVAFLLTEQDLDLLIHWGTCTPYHQGTNKQSEEMLADLKKLRSAAFNVG